MKTHSPLVSIHRLKIKCPVCGRNDNCAVSDDRRIAFCRRVQSDKPGRGGWTHILSENPAGAGRIQHVSQPKQEQTDRAPIEHRDAIYSTLIRKHLTLSHEHKRTLAARGMSEQEILRNGYVSTPDAHRALEIAEALSIFGLEGVPGFYKQGGEWRITPTRSGYFVPHRNERGQIQGMQYRLDEPLNDGKTKYLWLSSRDCSSGAPVHFAHGHLLHDAREVTITEGALKADIAAFFLQSPVIGIAGVSCFGADFAANLKAKYPKLEIVYLAFDADFQHNDGVKESLFRLADELQSAELRVQVRAWPARMGKGIDDYLLSVAKSEGRAAA
jgi:hypothetical protein